VTGPHTIRFRYPVGPLVLAAGCLGLGVTLGALLAREPGTPLTSALLVAALFAVSFGLVSTALVVLVPGITAGQRVTVDAAGIRIGRHLLPADRIGEVVLVDARTVDDTVLSARNQLRFDHRIEGRRLAVRHIAMTWDPLPAVLVEDRAGGTRPWRLFAVPDGVDADAVVSAAIAARDRAARGDHRA
jgi:hypothetical protein